MIDFADHFIQFYRYPAKVLEVGTKGVLIHFHGWGKRYDTLITDPSKIRHTKGKKFNKVSLEGKLFQSVLNNIKPVPKFF